MKCFGGPGIGSSAALAMVLALAACGGGGGGGGGGGRGPAASFTLSVTVSGSGTVSGASGAIQCGTGCSAPIAANDNVTLTATAAAGYRLASWGGDCSGQTSTCTVTMNAARSVSATFALAPQPPKGWGELTNVSADGAYGQDGSPVLAGIDAAGNATVVWHQYAVAGNYGSPRRLMANRFTSAGWGTPVEVVPPPEVASIHSPQLAVDPQTGRAMLVWILQDSTTTNVLSRAFDPATGWGPIESVEPFPSNLLGGVRVAIDGSGRATAAWVHDPDGPGPNPYNIYANRHQPGSGWGTPVAVSQQKGGAANPRLAAAPSGNVFLVWGGNGPIWGAQFTGSTGSAWSEPAEVVPVTDAASSPALFDVAASASEALLLWNETTYNTSTFEWRSTMKSKRFSSGGWQQTASTVALAVLLSSPNSEMVLQPDLVMNASGDAAALWGNAAGRLYASTATPNGTWSTVTAVNGSQLPGYENLLLCAAIDSLGNVLVAWTAALLTTSPADLYTQQFIDDRWSGPTRQENLNGVGELSVVPAVAMNERGTSVVAWVQGIEQADRSLQARTVARIYTP